MGAQQRPGDATVEWVEEYGRAVAIEAVAKIAAGVAGDGVGQIGVAASHLRLAEIERRGGGGGVNGPVPDGGIHVGLAHALGRKLRADPLVEVLGGEGDAVVGL